MFYWSVRLSSKEKDVVMGVHAETEGNGLFITLVPKVYTNVFLFVGLTTLQTLIDGFIKLSVRTFLITNFNLKKGEFCVTLLGMYINLLLAIV